MMLTRRGFLKGMAGILAAGVAPAVIGSNILMPVRKLWTPPMEVGSWQNFTFIESNPGTTQSLLMSIWMEDGQGRRLWTHEYTPPLPMQTGENIIAMPKPDNSRFVTVNATWTEYPKA